MITLGQASNYSLGRVLRHTFAWGSKKDSLSLREVLAQRYQVATDQVALYHTGRSALTVALQSAAKGKKRYVIIPGLTCIAVVRAVKAAGLIPVFVDIEREDLEYDYAKLEQKLEEIGKKEAKTIDKNDEVCYNGSIVLVQNTLGISWDIQKIEKIAQKHQAIIVEDLAHCAGRFYADGREVGTVGRAAALSFGKGKAIDTISGGAVIVHEKEQIAQPTKKPKLSDRLRDRWYPFFGMTARWTWRIKLGRLWMGVLVKLRFVQRSADAILDTKQRLTHWQARLALKQLDSLSKQRLRDYRLVNNREDLLQKLEQKGYDLKEIWYDTPVSPKRYTKEVDFPEHECPKTVKIAQEIINFPTWYPKQRMIEAYKLTEEYEIK